MSVSKNFTSVAAVLALLLSAPQSFATANPANDVASVPQVLRQNLNAQQTQEGYIAQVLNVIRRNAKDRITLTKADIEAARQSSEEEAKTRQITMLVAHDSNHDSVVTKEEVLQRFMRMRNREPGAQDMTPERKIMFERNVESQVRQVMKFDRNDDGKVTYQEMAMLDDTEFRNSRFGGGDPAQYLDLDPDKDGRLSVTELEKIARAAFGQIDSDQDTILSQEEVATLNELKQREVQVAPGCKIQNIPANARIALLSIYEGEALSSVTVAGQDRETNVVKVDISGEDKRPLYLIAASYSPTIWDLSGKVDKIAGMIIYSPENAEGKITAGATRIAAAKLSYEERNQCLGNLPYSEEKNKTEGARKRPDANSFVKALTGRDAYMTGIQYSVYKAHISDTEISFDQVLDKMPVPKGLAAAEWESVLRFNKAGVAFLSPRDIVSKVKAENYEVLPQEAGIAQLMAQGKIVAGDKKIMEFSFGQDTVIIDGGGGEDRFVMNGRPVPKARSLLGNYKIIKEIRLPPGMSGAHSKEFILGKGVPVPRGDPGHSCVKAEETGKTILGFCAGDGR